MAVLQGSNLDFNNQTRCINVAPPVNDTDGARLIDIKTYIHGLSWKDDCRVSSPSNVNIASPGATIDGITMALNDLVLLQNQTTTTQNGIYVWNGAAVAMTRAPNCDTFDELEGAVTVVTEGTLAGSYRQTQVNGVIGTNAILWTNFLTGSPAATETIQGIMRIATQADTDTGTVDDEAVTPLKLTNWTRRSRMFTQVFGDGSTTQFDFTHNWNTRNYSITVYRNSGNFDNIGCDLSRPTVNAVRANFEVAPTVNQFVIVILGQVTA